MIVFSHTIFQYTLFPYTSTLPKAATMKVGIDLKDPRMKFARAILQMQAEKALSTPQRIESAVLPIYHTKKLSPKLEQIGSGVALQINGEYFVLSASHVFDAIGHYALCIGTGRGELLTQFLGDRFSSRRGPSGTHADDPVDASVYHIQSIVPDSFKDVALTLADLDLSHTDELGCIHMAAGFRAKISNTIGNQANSKRECFLSRELDETGYQALNLRRETHIAIAYENQIIKEERWQTSPTPKGISGGAMIRVTEVPMVIGPDYVPSNIPPKQVLRGITIEQRRERHRRPGAIIATRVGVHIGLINRFLPGLITSAQ
ncbi:hypothetical protein D3C85_955800 [compost metagenome]